MLYNGEIRKDQTNSGQLPVISNKQKTKFDNIKSSSDAVSRAQQKDKCKLDGLGMVETILERKDVVTHEEKGSTKQRSLYDT